MQRQRVLSKATRARSILHVRGSEGDSWRALPWPVEDALPWRSRGSCNMCWVGWTPFLGCVLSEDISACLAIFLTVYDIFPGWCILYFTLPFLTLPYIIFAYLTLPFLILPSVTFPYLTLHLFNNKGAMFEYIIGHLPCIITVLEFADSATAGSLIIPNSLFSQLALNTLRPECNVLVSGAWYRYVYNTVQGNQVTIVNSLLHRSPRAW